MPIFDPTPGEAPSTPTSATPSTDTGAEPPTSPGVRPAKAYTDRYEAPYGLADRMETLAGLILLGGLGMAGFLLLYGLSEEYAQNRMALLVALIVAPLAVGFYGVLALGVSLLRAFVDQAVHSAPLSDAEKQAIVFKKR
jgi:formate hydrogenlyase subunit 3/multisubunit Na+/H+ antiporter MnhD subunit